MLCHQSFISYSFYCTFSLEVTDEVDKVEAAEGFTKGDAERGVE